MMGKTETSLYGYGGVVTFDEMLWEVVGGPAEARCRSPMQDAGLRDTAACSASACFSGRSAAHRSSLTHPNIPIDSPPRLYPSRCWSWAERLSSMAAEDNFDLDGEESCPRCGTRLATVPDLQLRYTTCCGYCLYTHTHTHVVYLHTSCMWTPLPLLMRCSVPCTDCV